MKTPPLVFPAHHATEYATDRPTDIACLGRLAVDLYAQTVGCSLEAADRFAKYLGGSSANIAFGLARLGMKAAMISRVGDEQNGRFLLDTLAREGCDVSQVQRDRERLTALVMLGIKDQHTFPLLFVRENCADMALDAHELDERFIAQCRSLLITGTHLSTPTVLAASRRALEIAGRHGVVRVLDIDYRPVLWGLTGRGDGETRYVANDAVTAHLQRELHQFELIIGTEEEWRIAGGVSGETPGDLLASLRRVRACTQAALVVKRGAAGASVITGEVPDTLDDALTVLGERIEVLNVLGAGDAFAAGLLAGLLSGKSWRDALKIANACGAIVVSRHGCAPAMPTLAELAHWFSGHRYAVRQIRPDHDLQLAHLHRVSVRRKAVGTDWPELYVLAYDHRAQFEALAVDTGASASRLVQLKLLLNDVVAEVERHEPGCQGRLGVLIDGRPDLGQTALHAATGRGWWVGRPVERPGSRPLRFDAGRDVGTVLASWPREQVVKCLLSYHPDDPPMLRDEQEERLLQLWEATRASGHELLLEVVPPTAPCDTDTSDAGAAVVAAIARLYAIGLKPEWWKVPGMAADHWQALQALVHERDPWCRGAVVLGLAQPLEQLLTDLAVAARFAVAKGFMVGRSIWAEPARAWLAGQLDDDGLRGQVCARFLQLVHGWQAARAGVIAAETPGAVPNVAALAVS